MENIYPFTKQQLKSPRSVLINIGSGANDHFAKEKKQRRETVPSLVYLAVQKRFPGANCSTMLLLSVPESIIKKLTYAFCLRSKGGEKIHFFLHVERKFTNIIYQISRYNKILTVMLLQMTLKVVKEKIKIDTGVIEWEPKYVN